MTTGMGAIGVSGLWHFSFTVSDLERSIRFYSDLLGFELVHRQESRSEYISHLVGYPSAHLLVAMLRIPGQPLGPSTHHLELIEYIEPRGRRSEPEIRNPGEGHLAIAVPDAIAAYEWLRAQGVTFVSPPNAITAGANTGGYACYFRDPDQIVLELVQPPPKRQEPER